MLDNESMLKLILNQLALDHKLHVGPEPPTLEQYGETYKDMIWIDTADNSEAGMSDATIAVIEDLTNTVQDMSKQIEEMQRQLALIIATGGGSGPITAFNNCLELEDGSLFALEDGCILKLEFASEEESWNGTAYALEDGSVLTTEDNYILITEQQNQI